jgi:hypothetical protein
MSAQINCPHHSQINGQPVCQVVSDLIDRSLAECHTNDSACNHCLGCGVAPQRPNVVTASMAIGVALRSQDDEFSRRTERRFRPYLMAAPRPITACVLRGLEIRKVDCKPCQADSLVPVKVAVYRCPRHQECTLHNTGTFPKIQACATCGDRLEHYVELEATPIPAAVLAAMPRR